MLGRNLHLFCSGLRVLLGVMMGRLAIPVAMRVLVSLHWHYPDISFGLKNSRLPVYLVVYDQLRSCGFGKHAF
jgi:hypothetical protein